MALFTNQPGFGAHCRVDFGPRSDRKPIEGTFLHLGHDFLFAAQAREKRGRGREMTFLRNIETRQGHALNDALPGYAPLISASQVTGMESTGRAPAGKVNGYAATQEKVHFTLGDNSEVQLTVWRAEDLRGLPVRIQADAGLQPFTIDLTEVRLQEPAASLFEIPADFARYDHPKALVDELLRRDSITRRDRATRSAFDDDEFQRTGRMVPVE